MSNTNENQNTSVSKSDPDKGQTKTDLDHETKNSGSKAQVSAEGICVIHHSDKTITANVKDFTIEAWVKPQPRTNKAYRYPDAGFEGAQIELRLGAHKSLAPGTIPIVGSVWLPPYVVVVLFSKPNFKGKATMLRKAQMNLPSAPVGSAVVIHRKEGNQNVAVIFEGEKHSGKAEVVLGQETWTPGYLVKAESFLLPPSLSVLCETKNQRNQVLSGNIIRSSVSAHNLDPENPSWAKVTPRRLDYDWDKIADANAKKLQTEGGTTSVYLMKESSTNRYIEFNLLFNQITRDRTDIAMGQSRLKVGQWNHIAVSSKVLDKSEDKGEIKSRNEVISYLNGRPVNKISGLLNELKDSYEWELSYGFLGSVGELMLFDYVRTPDQIRTERFPDAKRTGKAPLLGPNNKDYSPLFGDDIASACQVSLPSAASKTRILDKAMMRVSQDKSAELATAHKAASAKLVAAHHQADRQLQAAHQAARKEILIKGLSRISFLRGGDLFLRLPGQRTQQIVTGVIAEKPRQTQKSAAHQAIMGEINRVTTEMKRFYFGPFSQSNCLPNVSKKDLSDVTINGVEDHEYANSLDDVYNQYLGDFQLQKLTKERDQYLQRHYGRSLESSTMPTFDYSKNSSDDALKMLRPTAIYLSYISWKDALDPISKEVQQIVQAHNAQQVRGEFGLGNSQPEEELPDYNFDALEELFADLTDLPDQFACDLAYFYFGAPARLSLLDPLRKAFEESELLAHENLTRIFYAIFKNYARILQPRDLLRERQKAGSHGDIPLFPTSAISTKVSDNLLIEVSNEFKLGQQFVEWKKAMNDLLKQVDALSSEASSTEKEEVVEELTGTNDTTSNLDGSVFVHAASFKTAKGGYAVSSATVLENTSGALQTFLAGNGLSRIRDVDFPIQIDQPIESQHPIVALACDSSGENKASHVNGKVVSFLYAIEASGKLFRAVLGEQPHIPLKPEYNERLTAPGGSLDTWDLAVDRAGQALAWTNGEGVFWADISEGWAVNQQSGLHVVAPKSDGKAIAVACSSNGSVVWIDQADGTIKTADFVGFGEPGATSYNPFSHPRRLFDVALPAKGLEIVPVANDDGSKGQTTEFAYWVSKERKTLFLPKIAEPTCYLHLVHPRSDHYVAHEDCVHLVKCPTDIWKGETDKGLQFAPASGDKNDQDLAFEPVSLNLRQGWRFTAQLTLTSLTNDSCVYALGSADTAHLLNCFIDQSGAPRLSVRFGGEVLSTGIKPAATKRLSAGIESTVTWQINAAGVVSTFIDGTLITTEDLNFELDEYVFEHHSLGVPIKDISHDIQPNALANPLPPMRELAKFKGNIRRLAAWNYVAPANEGPEKSDPSNLATSSLWESAQTSRPTWERTNVSFNSTLSYLHAGRLDGTERPLTLFPLQIDGGLTIESAIEESQAKLTMAHSEQQAARERAAKLKAAALAKAHAQLDAQATNLSSVKKTTTENLSQAQSDHDAKLASANNQRKRSDGNADKKRTQAQAQAKEIKANAKKQGDQQKADAARDKRERIAAANQRLSNKERERDSHR